MSDRILDLVRADLDARDAKGRETYGDSLRVDSPNDALQFGYEEILDAAMYWRQDIERRKRAVKLLQEIVRHCSYTRDEFDPLVRAGRLAIDALVALGAPVKP